MMNSEELICTAAYLTQYKRWRINRCRYERVGMYIRQCKLWLKYRQSICSALNLRSSLSGAVLLSLRPQGKDRGLGNP